MGSVTDFPGCPDIRRRTRVAWVHEISSRVTRVHPMCFFPVTKSQVLSLLVVNRELFIGTTSGSFLVCNSLSLLVYSVIRCHESLLDCLLPLTTTPGTWNVGAEESSREEHTRLVLTCGKGYRSICPGRAADGTSSGVGNSPSGKRQKSFILVWLADERETGK